MIVKNPGYPQGAPGFSHNNQNVRERLKSDCLFFFSFIWQFNFARVCGLLPPCGVANTYAVKVNQVKSHCQDLAMSIVHTLIHIYKIFFCPHVVNSFFCCMFGEQSKTQTMKKIKAFILKHYPPVVIAILIAIGLFAFGMLFALIENITPNVPVHLR